MVTPIPAATVIVMRPGPAGGAPELLMVERARAMAFAGGALVFPGGRVDPGDVALAQAMAGDADELAHRIAAVRETLEESGVALVPGLHAAREAHRRALHGGAGFGEVLAAAGAAFDPALLTPFARWRPDHAGRVFDTRFYLAAAPADAAPVVDGSENVRAFWASAAAVLAEADRGAASVIFPTRRNLERLARFGSLDDALADALAHPVRTITPWVEARGGAEHLCIPEDCGYPVTSEPLAQAMRG